MDVLLTADGLTKRFGAKHAVRGVSLTLSKGEVLGFLGPNGAGKSTTMKMLTGYLAPTSGTVTVCGALVTDGNPAARRRIGYLPEGAPLYGDMTVLGFLSFVADAHKLTGDVRTKALEGAVSALELENVTIERIETLSKGFKRRVGMAAAILHDPDVLILDEPTDGLDPNQKRQVRGLITSMAEHRAIIISTHILEEVDAICTRAVIISAGKIVADGTPDALRETSMYRGAIHLAVDSALGPDVKAALMATKGVQSVEETQEGTLVRLTALPRKGADLKTSVGDLVSEKDWDVKAFGIESGRLEDVFFKATQGGLS